MIKYKDFVIESVSSQKSLEWVAQYFEQDVIKKLHKAIMAGQKITKKQLINKYRLVTSDTSGFTNAVKKSTTLEEDVKKMLLDKNHNLVIHLDEMTPGSDVLGSYYKSEVIQNITPGDIESWNEISGYIKRGGTGYTSKEVLGWVTDVIVSDDTVLHELQHAYDEYRSGDATDMKVQAINHEIDMGKSQAWLDKDRRNWLNDLFNRRSPKAATYDEYAAYSHEVNARYAQAIVATKKDYKKRDGLSIEQFIQEFEDNFVSWEVLTDEQRNSMRKRAYAEFVELERYNVTNDSSDINKKGLNDKVDLYKSLSGNATKGIKLSDKKAHTTNILCVDAFKIPPTYTKRTSASRNWLNHIAQWSDERGRAVGIKLSELEKYINHDVIEEMGAQVNSSSIGTWEARRIGGESYAVHFPSNTLRIRGT